jgi:hypothetical protein
MSQLKAKRTHDINIINPTPNISETPIMNDQAVEDLCLLIKRKYEVVKCKKFIIQCIQALIHEHLSEI